MYRFAFTEVTYDMDNFNFIIDTKNLDITALLN